MDLHPFEEFHADKWKCLGDKDRRPTLEAVRKGHRCLMLFKGDCATISKNHIRVATKGKVTMLDNRSGQCRKAIETSVEQSVEREQRSGTGPYCHADNRFIVVVHGAGQHS